jgi:hypothetical protein
MAKRLSVALLLRSSYGLSAIANLLTSSNLFGRATYAHPFGQLVEVACDRSAVALNANAGFHREKFFRESMMLLVAVRVRE